MRAPIISVGSVFSSLTSERGIGVERGVSFGPLSRHRLDIYRASQTSERRPIAIFFYGGGWTDGDRATYEFVGAALAARGVTTVIPDYRLYPEVTFPDFMDDAARAYAWVDRNIGAACGERRPILLIGHSAGAYIAALLALDRSYLSRLGRNMPPPAAMVGLAGPYSFDPTTWPTTKDIFARAAGRPDAARPVAFARSGAPPALLLHGLEDETVQLYNTRDLAAALKKTGNEVQTIEYPGIGHVGLVLAMSTPFRWRAPALDNMVDFIDRHGGDQLEGRTCNGGDSH